MTKQLRAKAIEQPVAGRFVMTSWYEPGEANLNPRPAGPLRVNSPDVAMHPDFGKRDELRDNGLMIIAWEQWPADLEEAELYLEVWGGHPNTEGKRVSINGRGTYLLPKVGTEAAESTHQYPTICLERTDLVNGYNALQFACDTGETFWGHYIVYHGQLRGVLPDDHPWLAPSKNDDEGQCAGLASLRDRLSWKIESRDDAIDLALQASAQDAALIERVDFHAFYVGYDENGNTQSHDWHGYTRDRKPVGIVGSATEPAFAVCWDTSILPAQQDVRVRAVVKLKDPAGLELVTEPVEGLAITHPNGIAVELCSFRGDEKQSMWSRDGQAKGGVISLDVPPQQIERAQLYAVVWDGGRGEVQDPFTLNGHAVEIADKGHHNVLYRVVEVPSEYLVQGDNRVQLLSDTQHHGIEVLLPGPALMVRYKTES